VPLSDASHDISVRAGEDFEDLFENAPCGYLSILPDGTIAMANRTIAAWIGYARDDLVGRRIHDVLTFATKIFLETHMLPLLRMQEKVDEVALDFVQSDGGKLPTLANATEHRDGSGRHLSTRLIMLKAVDRRRYERELVVARDEAELAAAAEKEVSELREQFIAVLGHDLRNPLASIDGGVRLLAKETLSGRGRTILKLMEGSVVRASGLISNVLDFARGRLGGGLTLDRHPKAPLLAMLEQVVAELRSTAPDRIIETQFAIRHSVNCDATRIGQLASNLIGNALTHGADDQPVRVHCSATDMVLELSVSNGGRPISPEAIEHLFQPFFRGKVKANQEGLGLGLFIASQIAKAHDGELNATSTETETRFTFTMPLDHHPE
jgi:sigma-B regulation protein RsbU (phosphoserine phosphatase)